MNNRKSYRKLLVIDGVSNSVKSMVKRCNNLIEVSTTNPNFFSDGKPYPCEFLLTEEDAKNLLNRIMHGDKIIILVARYCSDASKIVEGYEDYGDVFESLTWKNSI